MWSFFIISKKIKKIFKCPEAPKTKGLSYFCMGIITKNLKNFKFLLYKLSEIIYNRFHHLKNETPQIGINSPQIFLI